MVSKSLYCAVCGINETLKITGREQRYTLCVTNDNNDNNSNSNNNNNGLWQPRSNVYPFHQIFLPIVLLSIHLHCAITHTQAHTPSENERHTQTEICRQTSSLLSHPFNYNECVFVCVCGCDIYTSSSIHCYHYYYCYCCYHHNGLLAKYVLHL